MWQGDGQLYSDVPVPKYKDKGCDRATAYVGRRATCKNCPFRECLEILLPGPKWNGIRIEHFRHLGKGLTTDKYRVLKKRKAVLQ